MIHNLRSTHLVRVAIALLVGTVTWVVLAPLAMAKPNPSRESRLEFSEAMRKLWEDHIMWTRLYIISAAANLSDKDATTQRLLQNQADIGNAVAVFYGAEAGAKLTALLREHILGAAALIEAAKSGDKAKTDTAAGLWYKNADEIATFLSSANPSRWPLADMKAGMKMHLDLTLAEATDRLHGQYAADVQDYDKIHAHILGLADLLSNGIIQQFPDRFQTGK